MKTVDKVHKLWGKINETTTVDTALVLEEIKDGISIKPLRAVLLWFAAWTLKKKGPGSWILYYFKYAFALVLVHPSVLKLIVNMIWQESNGVKSALLTLIQFYNDNNIDYIVLGLITFVLLFALTLNYLSNKAKANSEIIRRQILQSIRPIVTFDEFLGFYQKHEVKQFVNSPTYDTIKGIIADPSKGNVRLMALSGTGKTFLIQSAILEAGDTSKVFYCDEVRHQDMLSAALNLSNEFEGGTLILDNCPSDVCDDVIKRVDGKVRIISAYYDPNDSAQYASPLTFGECDMRDIVTRIIEENVSRDITAEQKQKLIIHSGDIPFMALLLAKAYNASEGILENVDRSLLDHLLDIKGQHTTEQRIAMRTLSLLQPFEFNNAQSDIAKYLICSDEYTPIEVNLNRDLLFKNVVRNLNSRSLIDQDSVFINVRPQPLAIWLVGEWIKERRAGIVDAMVELSQQKDHVKKPILESWARRLEYMQGNEQAEALYAELVKLNDGPFAHEDVVCSDFGSRLILAMSTVNPVAVSDCLYGVLFRQSIEWLHDNLVGDARRNIVRALEKLCFCRDSFHYSAMLLARLALAENEDWANNSKGQFNQIFHVFLAGTEATLDDRIEVLKDLYKEDIVFHSLLLSAIKGAFATEHLSRMGGAEKFGFRELVDYHPTYSSIRKYWDNLYDFMAKWLTENPIDLYRIADIVQTNTRHFIRNGNAELLFRFLDLLAPEMDYRWNEMNKALVDTICYDHPSPELQTKLQSWVEKLEPEDIVSKMKAAVHELYAKDRNFDNIIEKEERIVIPFAKEFVSQKKYITREFDDLVLNTTDYISWAFYTHVALNIQSDAILELNSYALSIVKMRDKDFYSPFLVSLYSKIEDKRMACDFAKALYEAQYYRLSMSLFAVTDNLEYDNLRLALIYVKEGVISTDEIRQYLSAIRLPTANEILKVLTIIEEEIDNISLEFDFVSHYWYLDEFYKNKQLLVKFKHIILDYPILDNTHYNYEYTRLVENLLKKTEDNDFAVQLNKKLIDLMSTHVTHNGLEDLYDILLSKYRDAIWPDFIEALTDIENRIGFLIHLRYKIGSGFEFGEKSLFAGHLDEMKQVCIDYPQHGPWVCAALCPVFDKANEFTGEIESFHPFAIWLLMKYGDDKKILDEFHSNMGTFHWTGSVVPLIEDRKRCLENLLKIPNIPDSLKDWIVLCIEDCQREYDRETQNDAYMRMAYGVTH